jgi:hypothetical protein
VADSKRIPAVIFEDARVLFRNFSGKEGKYNREGDRNFCLLLDEETAEAMGADGWNVKYLRAREDGDVPQAYIEVAVSYRGRPPRIVMITSRGRTNLDESMINILDWAEIEKVDLSINPYSWSVQEKSGIKAYLASFYITIHEDTLELKYADVPELPDSGQSAIVVDAEIISEEQWPPALGRGQREITSGTPF